MAETIIVDFWFWALQQPAREIERLATLLSTTERKRAGRFLSPAHGAGFIAGRGRLREILAQYTGVPPGDLRFSTGPAGKPALAGLPVPPHFNLSHTGDWAGLAVTARHALGIDIETVRHYSAAIAGRYFAPAETAAIAALPLEARTDAFFRCWTRKEAFIKATGEGFGLPLRSFEVSLLAGQPPAVIAIAGGTTQDVAGWRLVHLDPAPGIVGAIALAAGDATTRVVVQHK